MYSSPWRDIPIAVRTGAWCLSSPRARWPDPEPRPGRRVGDAGEPGRCVSARDWRRAPSGRGRVAQCPGSAEPPPPILPRASAAPRLRFTRHPLSPNSASGHLLPQMFRGPRNRVNSTTPLARPDLVREMGRCGGPVTEGTRGRCDTLYIGAVCNAGVASISWTPERLQSKRRDGRKTFPLRAGVPASDGEVGAGGPHARGVGRWMRIQVEAAGIEPASASTPPLALHV